MIDSMKLARIISDSLLRDSNFCQFMERNLDKMFEFKFNFKLMSYEDSIYLESAEINEV